MEKRISTNKLINGETVSYTLFYFISVFLLMAVKQIFKTFFGLSAEVSCLIAFIISEFVLYLFEKRFVFRKSIFSSTVKQLIMLLVRGAADFGFYKLAQLCFYDLLDMPVSFVWLVAISISFFFNYFYDRVLLFNCNYEAFEIKKSRIYKFFFFNRYVFFSMLLAALGLCVIFIVYSVFPFGDYTVMRMDLYHQYGPLFAELYDRIVEHKSLLYSWNTGGGSSFLGNYLNYLSSPLTALIFLFDKEDISFAITFLVSVKCVLSAGTFTFYIKKSVKSHNFISAAFGVLYAFCAYFMAYYWNVMWLDGMILLPLILLGIERIIKKGDALLYVVSLALLLFSNYYIGFMTCIFAVLYFLVYFVIDSHSDVKLDPDAQFDKKYSFKALSNIKFFNRGVRFAFASIFSACLCAVALIPVFMILRGSSATSDTFPTTFTSYFNVFDFITSHFAGVEETIRSSGDDVLPNVYCGVLTILLLPMFVVNNKIRFKDKAVYLLLLIFLFVSFNNNCFNFVWHAMHFPNDLPYRFSYMYSFILLIVGYKAFIHLKDLTVRDIGFVGIGWVFLVSVAQKLGTTKMTERTVYMTIGFIILWTGFLMIVRKGVFKKVLVSAMAVVFVLCEVIITDTTSFVISQTNEDYKANYPTYTEAIDYIKNNEKDFCRTELCYLETRMDPAYYGYNGMSIFSSMAYESYSELQSNLGMFSNKINSYTYYTQTPVYNMMFNLKYLIQTDVSLPPSDSLYTQIYETSDGISRVYENKYYLPIAYCVNEKIDDWVIDSSNPFISQSDFLHLSTGYADVFEEAEYESTLYDGLSGDVVTQNGTYWFSKFDEESNYGQIDITVSPNTDGNFYIYVKSSDVETIEVNSDRVASQIQSISEPYILDIGYHQSSDEITISIDGGNTEGTDGYFEIYCYSVNEDVLNKSYNALKNNAMNVTSYDDTHIEGTVNVKGGSYIYTSIPYDDGWKVYIDGEEAETFEIGGTMLGTTATAGEHEIEFVFTPSGLKYGAVISAASLIAFAGYLIYKKKFSEISKNSRHTGS